MMIENQEFYNYKKLIIFGTEDSGKTSLVKRIEKGTFTKEKHSKDVFTINYISIGCELNNKLNLNIYEIRIDEDFINNVDLIDSFLFECQCILLLFDITNLHNFSLIKQFINNIDINRYKYLKIIFVPNKLDLEKERKISNLDINKFLKNKDYIDIQEISVKTGNNIQNLIEKIRISVANTKHKGSFYSISGLGTKNIALNDTQTLNFLLLGDKNVGKTVFFNGYFHKKFDDPMQTTIGIVKCMRYIKLDNIIYKLTIMDSSGSKKFRNLLNDKNIYKNIDGIFLFFDVTKEDTFSIIPSFIKYIKENSNKNINNALQNQNDILLFLIGNKIDKSNRVVPKEKAEEMANSFGMKYFN